MPKSVRKASTSQKHRHRTKTSSRAKPVAGTHAHSEFELSNEQIESALRTGDDAGLLEDYFGADEYTELRRLARDASARGVRGGPKVLILPGIMGSKIGKPGRFSVFDDV